MYYLTSFPTQHVRRGKLATGIFAIETVCATLACATFGFLCVDRLDFIVDFRRFGLEMVAAARAGAGIFPRPIVGMHEIIQLLPAAVGGQCLGKARPYMGGLEVIEAALIVSAQANRA